MALGKTVAAEPLDLLEAISGKFGIVAASRHVADQLIFEFSDGADIAERRHGPA